MPILTKVWPAVDGIRGRMEDGQEVSLDFPPRSDVMGFFRLGEYTKADARRDRKLAKGKARRAKGFYVFERARTERMGDVFCRILPVQIYTRR